MEEIVYNLNARDYLSALRYRYLRKSFGWHVASYIFAAVAYSYVVQTSLWFLGIFVIVGILIEFLAYWLVFFPITARKLVAGVPSSAAATRVKFGGDTLDLESSAGTSSIKWIYDVTRSREVILVYMSKGSFYPIPKLAFKDEDQIKRFLACCMALKSAAKQSQTPV